MTYDATIKTLSGYSAYIPVTANGSSTIFTLTKPSATFPNGTPNNVYGTMTSDFRTGTPSSPGSDSLMGGNITTRSSSPSISFTYTGNYSGVVRFEGYVIDVNYQALPAGSYTLNSTFTCVAN